MDGRAHDTVQTVTAQQAAESLGISLTAVYRLLKPIDPEQRPYHYDLKTIQKRKQKMDSRSTVDYTSIEKYCRQTGSEICRYINDPLAFIRVAMQEARSDLERAEFLSNRFEHWGLSAASVRLFVYYGKLAQKRKVVARHDNGGKYEVAIYSVAALLDYVELSASVEDSTSTDPVRTLYRLISKFTKHYKRNRRTLKGAIWLLKAENCLRELRRYAGPDAPPLVDGAIDITPRRLNNYIAQSVQAIADADPVWRYTPALDLDINPDRIYPVRITEGGELHILTAYGDDGFASSYEAQQITHDQVDMGYGVTVPVKRELPVTLVQGAAILRYPSAYQKTGEVLWADLPNGCVYSVDGHLLTKTADVQIDRYTWVTP